MDVEEDLAQTYQDDEAALLDAVAEEDGFDETDLESDFDNVQQQQQPQASSKGLVIEIPTSTLIAPRSAFSTNVFTTSEYEAVQSLLGCDPTQLDEDFVEFELDNFVVYIDTQRHPKEMRALHTFATSTGQEKFFFNGTLKLGDVKYRVEKVPFEEIPLGNYGKDNPTVGDQFWIRSNLNRRESIYYKLKTPSIEYARFHRDFLWVADLAKHVVDFSEHLLEMRQNVSIRHFEQDFARWLQANHGGSPTFEKWYKKREATDFRQSILANRWFVRKEVFAMLKGQNWSRIHLFREIADPLSMYTRQGLLLKADEIVPTIVTPYIFDCFAHMKMGELLRPVQPLVSTEEAVAHSWPANGTRSARFVRSVCTSIHRQTMIDSIKAGDTISIAIDADAKWFTNQADKKWYGLVQSVSTARSQRQFDVTWLYDPEDTPCCSMVYPWKNELFLSDHCTCEERQRRIPDHAVIGVHTVDWFGTPQTTAEFFIRQTYQVAQRRWVTLREAHIRCRHEEQYRPEYLVGDTVLVSKPGAEFLEPCEILAYDNDYKNTRLRKLLRRETIASQAARNELVYTDEEFSAAIHCIHARCIIRCYCPGEAIPAPYNRNGTGNAFVITHRKSDDGSITPLSSGNKPTIRQGFDPKRDRKKLRALDLFSGCGNLGRGLEDGGAVEAKWVNDIWDAAIHTYMANCRNPDSVHPFLGSIDELNLRAFQGEFSDSVPRPGQVDLICGGSPCPGFSLMTPDKQTLKQVKNRSLVAAFAATVDLYRPQYGILENVITIVRSKGNGKGKVTEDYFSQLICALVGMGYQAQIILGDAWSHGAPQRRKRAFLYFAAPGLELPLPPVPSHSHPENINVGSLGKMTNGEPYVVRLDEPTAFRYVTALQATADLPDVYDAKTQTCVAFPDHRLSISLASGDMKNRGKHGQGKNGRTQNLNMPIRPFGMNISRAWHHKIRDKLSGDTFQDMFDHERDAYPGDDVFRSSSNSKGWGRVHPHGLFNTVTTCCVWTDARIGRLSHWDQPRPLTVMEVRRAQGIPDNEVLVGKPRDQWHMVGNAVAGQIATALGLALRKAWVGTLYEDEEAAPPAPLAVGDNGQAAENGVDYVDSPVTNGFGPMLLD